MLDHVLQSLLVTAVFGPILGATASCGDARDRSAGDQTRGTCLTSEDCGGGECIAVPDTAEGYHTCVELRHEATVCTGMSGEDQCCNSGECPEGGSCFEGPLFACGGAPPIERNICAMPECSSDGDCTSGDNGLCLPAGAFGEPVARCLYGTCRVNSDCRAGPGGQCTPFNGCGRRLSGFECTYSDSACRSDSDCSHGRVCVWKGETTACEEYFAPP